MPRLLCDYLLPSMKLRMEIDIFAQIQMSYLDFIVTVTHILRDSSEINLDIACCPDASSVSDLHLVGRIIT